MAKTNVEGLDSRGYIIKGIGIPRFARDKENARDKPQKVQGRLQSPLVMEVGLLSLFLFWFLGFALWSIFVSHGSSMTQLGQQKREGKLQSYPLTWFGKTKPLAFSPLVKDRKREVESATDNNRISAVRKCGVADQHSEKNRNWRLSW